MRKTLLLPAIALMAWGCSDSSTEPSVATSVTFAPASVSLDAIGATQVVRASVLDQDGDRMDDAAVTWTSSAPAVTVLALGGDSARVTSTANGTATVTAQSGSASGLLEVRVAQVATSAEQAGGDTQTGGASSVLANPLRVRVRDRLNMPVAGQTVNFVVTSGGGSLSLATTTTDANGIAAVTFTLGPALGGNSVVASFPGTSLTAVTFTAQGVPLTSASLSVVSGGYQAAILGTAVPLAPTVAVRGAAGNPIPGVTVTFSVRAGGGTVGPGGATSVTVVTNASGQASVSPWTLGSSADLNILQVTAGGITGGPLELRGVGCSGGGDTGSYAITLCITTSMTPSQRAAFTNAANRWGQIVIGDLPASAGALPENSCGANPSANFTYDDVVIFAAVSVIDGPGSVLGQAGPCFIRTTGKLPVIGTMQFDVADLAALESANQLGNVILHEMGHVLGIGSLWEDFNLLQNLSSAGSPLDTYYTGAGGLLGFDAIGGTTYTRGQKVPVENTGGPGTVNSHWRESVLANELMTGFLNSGSNPLSVLTVRSLTDMGYQVAVSAADPFSLTLSLQAGVGTKALRLHDDVFRGPRYTLSPRGEYARLR
jgi:hypothetical protein